MVAVPHPLLASAVKEWIYKQEILFLSPTKSSQLLSLFPGGKSVLSGDKAESIFLKCKLKKDVLVVPD